MGIMVMAMVMDIMVILIATAMNTFVTGIVVTTVQGLAPVIGDEINEQADDLSLMKAFPLQCRHSHPNNPDLFFPAPLPQETAPSS